MKQQTAVEWIEELFDKYMAWRTGDHKATEYTYQDLVNDFDKARQMEKEQIVKAREDGISDGYRDYIDVQHGTESTLKSGEQYFSETYNTEQK